MPEWLQHMMDPTQPKGTRHAPEFILASMRAMGRGAMSSRVNDLAKIFYESVGIVIPKQNLPDQTTQRRWRYGMQYICMVQVGEVLTRAVRNGDTKMVITSDGTPVDGFHVEGAVVKFKGGQLSLVPHIQGSKDAETSGKNLVASVDECQQMFNEVRVNMFAT